MSSGHHRICPHCSFTIFGSCNRTENGLASEVIFSQLIVVGSDYKYPTLGYLDDDTMTGLRLIAEAGEMTSVYFTEYQMVIKALREVWVAGHVTQKELGKMPGRPQSFIAKIENGERRLDIAEFVYLCRLVGIGPISITNKLQC